MIDLLVLAPNTGRRIDNAALIDSGAESSAFPMHWMSKLDISIEECEERLFDSASGEARQWAYGPGLEALVLGHRIHLHANFCDTPIALVGRSDFLAHFRVTFVQRKDSPHFIIDAL